MDFCQVFSNRAHPPSVLPVMKGLIPTSISLPRLRDPRWAQIAVLGSLLTHGTANFSFAPSIGVIALTLGTAFLVQAVCSRWVKIPFDPRSPLITGLSLCLLLRTSHPGWMVVAAGIAIASKFCIRSSGKHIFNPANLAIAALVFLPDVWVSPGQWGSGPVLVFFFAGLGLLVLSRTARSDVTWAFLIAYALFLFGRALWLGDPWSIPLRQLQNGAVLLFAFFMISDPRTVPDHRIGRIAFAVIVAGLGVGLNFNVIDPATNGLFFALTACCLFVPLMNRWWKAPQFVWSQTTASKPPSHALPIAQPAHPLPKGHLS